MEPTNNVQETAWHFSSEDLLWHSRVKDGFRFLSVPAWSDQIKWQRILNTVFKGIEPQKQELIPRFVYGTLIPAQKSFIACTFLDPGPLPDGDPRPITHSYIWFIPDLTKAKVAQLPADWPQQLFKLLLPIRNEVYDIPLSDPIISTVHNAVKEAFLNSGAEAIHTNFVDRGRIDDNLTESTIQTTPRRPEPKGNKEPLKVSKNGGRIAGGLIGGMGAMALGAPVIITAVCTIGGAVIGGEVISYINNVDTEN
jgi:hypothetical protein